MAAQPSYADRIDFLLQLAASLHAYGTTAQRLEAAISKVAVRLRLRCNAWANPTGLILSVVDADAEVESGTPAAETTRVVRLEPGDVDLARLCAADAIAERVLAGEMGLSEGARALRELKAPSGAGAQALTAGSFGLASASVAGLLGTAWIDIATAACIGWLIGLLYVLGAGRPRLSEGLDAIAALLATLLATAVAFWIEPINLKTVVVASLIVLLPGLTLANAVSELSSQHLVAGTARFAGAVAILLKLTFGTVAATQFARLLGWVPLEPSAPMPPEWLEWASLLIAAFSFAVLFRADLRDYPVVMASAVLGYLCSRYGGAALGNEAGVFMAGLVVSSVSNVYARVLQRPGAVVRVPGMILLVPGSVGFRSLSFVFERDVFLGLDTGFTLITVLISLVAGLLFGNLLVPPRRSL
jgi:uncharacterized membrane protein YjjP (DUF1212 family)